MQRRCNYDPNGGYPYTSAYGANKYHDYLLLTGQSDSLQSTRYLAEDSLLSSRYARDALRTNIGDTLRSTDYDYDINQKYAVLLLPSDLDDEKQQAQQESIKRQFYKPHVFPANTISQDPLDQILSEQKNWFRGQPIVEPLFDTHTSLYDEPMHTTHNIYHTNNPLGQQQQQHPSAVNTTTMTTTQSGSNPDYYYLNMYQYMGSIMMKKDGSEPFGNKQQLHVAGDLKMPQGDSELKKMRKKGAVADEDDEETPKASKNKTKKGDAGKNAKEANKKPAAATNKAKKK